MKWVLLSLLSVLGGVGMQPLLASAPSTAASDSARPQILIEAVILEVALNRGEVGLDVIDAGKTLRRTQLASGSTSDPAAGQPPGFAYADRAGDLDAMLASLSRDARARILQRPRIQTSEDVTASLFVGESQPYPTQGGGTNIQQIPVGTTLDVTPFIKRAGVLTLDLHFRIDRFEGNVVVPNVGEVPTTSSREGRARFDVGDHETAVLGGLIGTNKKPVQAYVPFPKEVPVPAAMSSRGSNRLQRTELLVLVRPTLVKS